MIELINGVLIVLQAVVTVCATVYFLSEMVTREDVGERENAMLGLFVWILTGYNTVQYMILVRSLI